MTDISSFILHQDEEKNNPVCYDCNMVLKIRIQGRSGNLGSKLVEAIENDPDCSEDEFADVIIDVSHPDAFEECNVPLVIGSTGHNEENFSRMQLLAQSVPVLYAPNFSMGMTLLKELAMNIKGAVDAKIDVTEMHHDEKKDTPSGTAIQLANLLEAEAINAYRRPHAIGEHRVCFAFGDEEIEIRHKAHSRTAYALGALAAAKWIVKQSPGFYGMEDVCKI